MRPRRGSATGALALVCGAVLAVPLPAGAAGDVLDAPATRPGELVSLDVAAGRACAGLAYAVEHTYRTASGPASATDSGEVGPDGVLRLRTRVPLDAQRSDRDADLVGAGSRGGARLPDELSVQVPGCDRSWQAAVQVLPVSDDQRVTVSPAVVPPGEPVTVTATGCRGGAVGHVAAGRIALTRLSDDGSTWVGTARLPAVGPAPDAPVPVRVVCGQSTGQQDASFTVDAPAAPPPPPVELTAPPTLAPGASVTVRGTAPRTCAGVPATLTISYVRTSGQRGSAGGAAPVSPSGAVAVSARLPLDALPGPASLRLSTPPDRACGTASLTSRVLPRASDQRTSVDRPVLTGDVTETALEASRCFGPVTVTVQESPQRPAVPARLRDLEHDDTTGELRALVTVPGQAGSSVVVRVLCAQSTGAREAVVVLGGDAAVGVAASSLTVGEGAGSVRVDLRRGDDEPRPVTVRVGTRDGSARAGADYTATTRAVRFAAGQRLASITVPVLADGASEGDESFVVEVLDAPLDVLITEGVSTVRITDGPGPPAAPAAPGPGTVVDPALPVAPPVVPAVPAVPGLQPIGVAAPPDLGPELPFAAPDAPGPAPDVAPPVDATTQPPPATAPARSVLTEANPPSRDGAQAWPVTLLAGLAALVGAGAWLARRS